MPVPPQPPRAPQTGWVWRRADQAAIAGLVLCGLAATAVYYVRLGGLNGGAIELDRADKRPAKYLVDINAAQWPELAQLPDVGEELARRIVDDREQNGPYLDHAALRRVRGIGPKTLESMRPYLRPLPPAAATAGR